MELLQILYISLLTFMLISFTCVVIISKIDKDEDYSDFLLFTGTLPLVYLVGFVFGQEPVGASFTSLLHILPNFFLSRYLLRDVTEIKVSSFVVITAIALIVSTSLLISGATFTLYNFPIAMTAFSPGFYVIYKLLCNKKLSLSQKYTLFVMLILFTNYLTFPLFRFSPNAELWGWGSAVLGYICTMFSLVVVILERKVWLSNKLNSELTLVNTLYKSMMHDTNNDLTKTSLLLSKAIRRGELSSVEKALSQIKNIVDFKKKMQSEISNDNRTVHDVDPVEMTKVLEELNENAINEKGLILRKKISIDGNFKSMISQAVLVRSVFQNILSNAIKFSPYNSIVELVFYEDEEKLNFKVIDQGKGITKEIVDEVKEFNRVTSSTGTDGEKGTGMGLGIVCYIISSLNGQIDFYNTGGGTIIHISLPKYIDLIHKPHLIELDVENIH